MGWGFDPGLLNPRLVCSSLQRQGQRIINGLAFTLLIFLHELLRQFNTSSMDNIGHLFFSLPSSCNKYFIFHAIALLLLYACA